MGGAKPERGTTDVTVTMSSAWGTLSGRSTSVSARLNIAALAPTPIAIETMATNAKPGFFTSIRAPCRKSWNSPSIISPCLIAAAQRRVDCRGAPRRQIACEERWV